MAWRRHGRTRSSRDAGPGARVRVLHVLPDLQVGGGQGVVLQLLRQRDRSRFDVGVSYLTPPDEMARAFVDAGAPPVRLGRGTLVPALRLARLLAARRVDVLHVHSGPDRRCGHLAALLTGTPVVAHLHSPWDHRGPRPRPGTGTFSHLASQVKGDLRDRAERASVRAYVAAGDEVARFHAPLAHAPIITARNGVAPPPGDAAGPAGRDALRAELGIATDEPVLVSVGRLAVGKGQDRLLAWLPSLPGTLVLVGEGPERGRLEALAADHGVADRVRFTGSRSDVPQLLAAADVFVFASETEGLPLAVLEAEVAGLPVVALTLPGLLEVIQPGVGGVLVAHDDPAAFVAAVEAFVADPALRAEVGGAGRALVEERFGAVAMTAAVEDVYARISAPRGGRPRGRGGRDPAAGPPSRPTPPRP